MKIYVFENGSYAIGDDLYLSGKEIKAKESKMGSLLYVKCKNKVIKTDNREGF